jgi:hypothetical protein
LVKQVVVKQLKCHNILMKWVSAKEGRKLGVHSLEELLQCQFQNVFQKKWELDLDKKLAILFVLKIVLLQKLL